MHFPLDKEAAEGVKTKIMRLPEVVDVAARLAASGWLAYNVAACAPNPDVQTSSTPAGKSQEANPLPPGFKLFEQKNPDWIYFTIGHPQEWQVDLKSSYIEIKEPSGQARVTISTEILQKEGINVKEYFDARVKEYKIDPSKLKYSTLKGIDTMTYTDVLDSKATIATALIVKDILWIIAIEANSPTMSQKAKDQYQQMLNTFDITKRSTVAGPATPAPKEAPLSPAQEAQAAALNKIIEVLKTSSPNLERAGTLQSRVQEPAGGFPIADIIRGKSTNDEIMVEWKAVNESDLAITSGRAQLKNFQISRLSERQPSPAERDTYERIVEMDVGFALRYRTVMPWLTTKVGEITKFWDLNPADLKNGYEIPSPPTLSSQPQVDRKLTVVVGVQKNGTWIALKNLTYPIPNFKLSSGNCNPTHTNRAPNCEPVLIPLKPGTR